MNDKYTWDLTAMYKDLQAFEEDKKIIGKLSTNLTQKKGTLTTSANNLLEALQMKDELSIKLMKVYVYAKMSFDQNMANAKSKQLFEVAHNLHSKVQNQLSFLEPELLVLDETTYAKYVENTPELSIYNHMFEKLFKMKEHVLSKEQEEILSHMNSIGSSFEKIYDDLTVNDIKYPIVKDSTGEEIIANNNNYYKALISPDRTLRENFFKSILGTYGTYINSFTSSYYGAVKHDVSLAEIKNYKSSRHMALSQNFIPEEVYDNLIKTVTANVAPLQEYIEYRRSKLGLDEVHFYDLFVPIVNDIDKTYTFEEARDLVLKATSILGEDYTDILKRAFDERWIDVYPNKNKVSGAYAISAYGYHPYSLLNFNGTLNDVFTLAHELGHVMHSYYSEKNQPFVNSDYTIFTAEVASTVNEQLLHHYLLNNTTNNNEKALLLSMHLDNIRSTLYRQTLFADFENQAHKMVDNGDPLLPNTLCDLHESLYQKYHGKKFSIDSELKYEWARIPHFYRSFYVFQYSTGISAAISIAKKLLNEKEAAVKNYRDFLTKGGSDYSLKLLKTAGVDMTSKEPILAAIKDFQETLKSLQEI
ncbi:oligoendopeptidase F [Desulfonispora thiosulfatigenes DSM 11270]|uniref:Oligopeptidase F n=1 Tax=Desulfonispora thiosulfatigenes DSM 11270 TaxID=656914 RepID=A0A1W1VHB3_DESTI|nr:oligoendopeptidase F [Desulfonispora thiosulfatigenes]SMB92748.1 oligoendopeptidase F [Desulfonispora thiosulfatigenes DSM 11270]